jgi:hypothetical protein
MSVRFNLNQRLAGYAATIDEPGGKVGVCYRELIGPEQATHLQCQLENMQNVLFSVRTTNADRRNLPGHEVPPLGIWAALCVLQ